MAKKSRPTGALAKIDNRLSGLQPGSTRHQVVAALRQFRASWVELGRLLNEVAYGGDYKEWGYDDFEVYCARELGLKKPTVQKLMISYNYLKKHEGRRLADYEDAAAGDRPAIPDYQTVELLDRIKRAEELPEAEAEEMHRRAFESESDDETELRRELRLRLRPAAIAPPADIDPLVRELAPVIGAARELRRRLSMCASVPEGLRGRLEQCLVELEALT